MTKVVVLEKFKKNWEIGSVVSVKDGYARNYLIPQGLAVLATEEALQRTTKLRAEAEERRIQETKDWQIVADSLEGMELDLEVRTGPTGRLGPDCELGAAPRQKATRSCVSGACDSGCHD